MLLVLAVAIRGDFSFVDVEADVEADNLFASHRWNPFGRLRSLVTGIPSWKRIKDPGERLAEWLKVKKNPCSRWKAVEAFVPSLGAKGCVCEAGYFISPRCGLERWYGNRPDGPWHPLKSCELEQLERNGERNYSCTFWSPKCTCEVEKKFGGFLHRSDKPEDVGIHAVDFCTRLFTAVSEEDQRYQGRVPWDSKEVVASSARKSKEILKTHKADEYCQLAVSGVERPVTAAKQLAEQNQSWLNTEQHKNPSAPRVVELHRVQGHPETSWQHSFTHICKEECDDIVQTLKNESEAILWQEAGHHAPLEQSCANFVVKQVESHVLGCCAFSCRWNGKGCLNWPIYE